MDFFSEAVDVLAAIVRALSCPDSPEDYFGESGQEMFPVKEKEAAILPVRIRRLWPPILPVRIRRLWPPIRAEPGNGRQGRILTKNNKIKEKG
ncbi:hypothetical protein [Lachnoclostridium sp. An76]|uniref:hypothetical protein n=1 Tax=Lachnoclostridium sp. An76 TaxID=1965654 RepID=UPI000B3963D9|nr:hypothetical protein [Lachnoclostridium sp. An76]OUN34171.1 hypothetical protein B5G27_08870 [Lachnoclostridium sp. An76]